MKVGSITLTLFGVFCAASAYATPITVLNPGFESPVLTDGAGAAASGYDWGSPFVLSIYNPTATDLPGGNAPEGQNLGISSSVAAALTQTVGVVKAGTYTLNFTMARNLQAFLGVPVYSAKLLGGASVIAADNNSLSLPLGGIASSSAIGVVPPGSPLIGQSLTISFSNTGAAAYGWDAVSLDFVAVPEPTSLSLAVLGAGVLAVIAAKRRRLNL